jgi:hypothetical protein
MEKTMKTVKDLFLGSSGKVIYKWHHYLPIYESLFNKFVGKKVKVLEIGVLRGGSLKLWREYFGPQAEIYGIDIDPNVKQYESEGIKIYVGDQGDQNFLKKLSDEAGGFDIVIDDGGHTNYLVRNSFEALYPSTRHLYVVEDTHALYWWGGIYSLIRDIQFTVWAKKGLVPTVKIISDILCRFLTGNLSFMSLVKKKQDALTTEWHGNWKRHSTESSNERRGTTKVSEFAATTSGIRVYDSVVVFEKEPQQARIADIR